MRTKLVAHFYVSSILVLVLSQGVKHAVRPPLLLYIMGAAVLYRFVTLLLISRDMLSCDRPAQKVGTPDPAGMVECPR